MSGIELRPYQTAAVEHAIAFFRTARPGEKRLYAGPTGVGKSVIELAVQGAVPSTWIVTPSLEIVDGFLAKLGFDLDGTSEATWIDLAARNGITTPIRLRNRLMNDPTAFVPRGLIWDEGHHQTASSWQDIEYLCGRCPSVAYTATPYRGTPKGTVEFRRQWGEPVWILTYREAVEHGYISLPTCRIAPILDDDLVEVQNGEFSVQSLNEATSDVLGNVVDLARPFFNGGAWDRPTMVAVPSGEVARELARRLVEAGLPAEVVLQDTKNRREVFARVLARETILVQVRVVSEGVDLPIRRLIDLSPCMSPVRWLQQFGRITRPTDTPPEYVCCNRNLLRHAYLLEGLVPPEVIADGCKVFGLSKRAGVRVVGLEGLGRFKGAEVPLADGSIGLCYALESWDGAQKQEYFAFIHPAWPEAIWAEKRSSRDDAGAITYGRWYPCDAPDGVQGFSSKTPGTLTDKQKAFWDRRAEAKGLDVSAKVNRKTFSVLPVLCDLGVEFRCY